MKDIHFYQQISDKYGDQFPAAVESLANMLPTLLNFDPVQLSFDSAGLDLVDEALKWAEPKAFDSMFPAVLAFYGQCYIAAKQDGQWAMLVDSSDQNLATGKKSNVWIPVVRLKDRSLAWDWIDFYKDLFEGPIPLRWAGDWDNSRRKIRLRTESDSRQ